MKKMLLMGARWGLLLGMLLTMVSAQAQVAYGISRTQTFIINQTTGVTSAPGVLNNYAAQLGYESSAMAVSPINGLVYMIERTTSTIPRFATWNPATGNAATVGNTGAVTADILRATFCPDGRLYIAGNGTGGGAGAEVYQINPATGAVIRTIRVQGVPTSGSGDIVCVNSGNMYILAQSTAGALPYQLFLFTTAQLSIGGNLQTATLVGNLGIDPLNAPNGLVEVGATTAGCAPSPAPCIFASGAPTGQVVYSLNTSTGAASTRTTASGAGLVDLSREFPRDVSVTKTASPTAALQGRLVQYTVTAANSGPAVAGSVTIADTLNSTAYNLASVTWTCSVIAAGSNTAVPTGCGAASGTGSISSYVNLSINSTVQYVITAPLQSSFTGTVTNSVSATLTGTTVDVTPSNNSATVTSTVSPAATITISKTDGTGTVLAGQTTSYTLTVANLGPANAPNALVTDPAVAGLNCTAVTCSVLSGTATCPAGPTISALQGAGLSIPVFNANSSLAFNVTCGVTATGQ